MGKRKLAMTIIRNSRPRNPYQRQMAVNTAKCIQAIALEASFASFCKALRSFCSSARLFSTASAICIATCMVLAMCIRHRIAPKAVATAIPRRTLQSLQMWRHYIGALAACMHIQRLPNRASIRPHPRRRLHLLRGAHHLLDGRRLPGARAALACACPTNASPGTCAESAAATRAARPSARAARASRAAAAGKTASSAGLLASSAAAACLCACMLRSGI